MDKVSRYSYINAKLRARIGLMAGSSLLEDMIKAPNLSEAIAVLSGTKYDSLFEAYSRTADLQQVELELFIREIRLHEEIIKALDDKTARFVKTLLEKTDATNVVGLIESLSSTVATDMSVADIAGLINSMRGMDTDAIYSANIPSTTANIDGVSYVIADEVALKDMMDRVDAGMDPGDSETMETTEEYTANQANGYVDSDGDGVLDDGGIDDGYASDTSVDSGY